jgi:hypothetical protein
LQQLPPFSTVRLTWMATPMPRSLQWVNTPVLLEALERYEQKRLPRSMQLWLEAVLELKTPAQGPLRPHC